MAERAAGELAVKTNAYQRHPFEAPFVCANDCDGGVLAAYAVGATVMLVCTDCGVERPMTSQDIALVEEVIVLPASVWEDG